MAYAAALLLGLALIWFGWSPQALDPYWLMTGALGVAVALALAVLMGGVDGEGAPYAKLPGALVRASADTRRIVAESLDLCRRAIAGDPMLKPALLRLKTRAGGESGRVAYANAIARAPGALVVDVEEESLLVHVLVESDANETALHQLDRGADS